MRCMRKNKVQCSTSLAYWQRAGEMYSFFRTESHRPWIATTPLDNLVGGFVQSYQTSKITD